MAYMYLPSNNKYKRTVTLLHGKNFTSNYWKQIALKLNSLGYAVLIPDQIGFGKSSKPLNYQFTFEALALNTKKLLDSLNITSQGRVIELNNTILNNNDLANIPLKDHDSLEIIQFMGGG